MSTTPSSPDIGRAGQQRMNALLEWVFRLRMLIILIVVAVAASVLTDYKFSQTSNLVVVARQMSFEAIIAFGMTLVIITGGIDLSVGSLVALTGVVAGLVMHACADCSATVTIGLGVLAAVSAGAFCGSANGLIITRFSLPPFLVTLAAMLVARGLAFILCNGEPISGSKLPEKLLFLGRGYVLQDLWGPLLPVPVLVMLVCFLLFWLLLSRTVFGRSVIAIGSNEHAARLSGIGVRRTKLAVYVLTGALCGVVGILHNSYLMSADPKVGQMMELYVIAAVVVGGTSLFGGRGSIPGTLAGALIIRILQNSLRLRGVDHFWQMVVLGVVILIAALLDAALSRLSRR